jgi:hypothetical protein
MIIVYVLIKWPFVDHFTWIFNPVTCVKIFLNNQNISKDVDLNHTLYMYIFLDVFLTNCTIQALIDKSFFGGKICQNNIRELFCSL